MGPIWNQGDDQSSEVAADLFYLHGTMEGIGNRASIDRYDKARLDTKKRLNCYIFYDLLFILYSLLSTFVSLFSLSLYIYIYVYITLHIACCICFVLHIATHNTIMYCSIF